MSHARVLADPAAQAEAILVGQHHVENHQIGGGFGVQRFAKTRAVGGGAHGETGATQVGVQQFADFLVVIDQQDRLAGSAHVGVLVVIAGSIRPAFFKA